MKYRRIPHWKYELVEDEELDLRPWIGARSASVPPVIFLVAGILTLRVGFCWDGASGGSIDTKTNARGSAAHDALYELIRKGLLPKTMRKPADQMFRDICREDGMHPLRARIDFRFLRRFGGRAARREKARRILEAP